jgi:tRNA threonylcarbamoyladenosine biosynthesis protein TsaB
MNHLALETSAFTGSVACLRGGQLLCERLLPSEQRSAQSLAPAIEAILREVGWRPRDLRLISFAAGPGSFTGLRVGVTTAKTLAYAVQAEVLAVDTLEALACQAWESGCRGGFHAVLDAQRQQLFAASFWLNDQGPERRSPTAIVDNAAWLAGLCAGEWVGGPAVERLSGQLPAEVLAATSAASPKASAVGQIAWRHYEHGRRDDLWKLAPAYYRPSAAEEKAALGELP